MTRNRVFHSFLLASGVLLIAACATTRPPGYLDEKYFQAEAKLYEKVQLEGMTVYCASRDFSSRQAYFPGQCISEADLRQVVHDRRRGM